MSVGAELFCASGAVSVSASLNVSVFKLMMPVMFSANSSKNVKVAIVQLLLIVSDLHPLWCTHNTCGPFLAAQVVERLEDCRPMIRGRGWRGRCRRRFRLQGDLMAFRQSIQRRCKIICRAPGTGDLRLMGGHLPLVLHLGIGKLALEPHPGGR